MSELTYNTVISPNDHMWLTGPQYYFSAGLSAIECIKRALATAHVTPESILDLPCGHGRVCRMLSAAYPAAHLTVCDLDRDGVDFCASEFAAEPLYSNDDLPTIAVGRHFDLIWCGSLFTHLDRDRWPEFLGFFADHLSEDGVLVFTTHGRQPIQWMLNGVYEYGLSRDEQETLMAAYDRHGFGFVSPANQAFGISLSSVVFVCTQLERFSSIRLIGVHEAGWASHHDVFSCQHLRTPFVPPPHPPANSRRDAPMTLIQRLTTGIFGLRRTAGEETPSLGSHSETLDRLLRHHGAGCSPRQLFARVSDDFWWWCFTDGYRSEERLRSILPAFPPPEVQVGFTGSSGDDTMREAFGFYRLVKSLASQHLSRPLHSVLEFGCGWGRMLRLFTKDIDPQELWGIDCMPTAIDLCQKTSTYSQFQLVDPFPPTNVPSERFDLVYAYSVFSHLSEAAHLQWLEEFRRILKPGGLLIATTRQREFLLACAKARAEGEDRAWAQHLVVSFRDTQDALARYDRGEFLHDAIGGGGVLDGSFFGETCIPRQYAEANWPRFLEYVGYVDDRGLCQQNVIVARKT